MIRSLLQKRFLSSAEINFPQRIEREGESLATMKARLLYQSRKRGILESDLLCSTFALKYLNSLSEAQLSEYDKLLDENDWDLYYWASEKKEVPERLKENSILPLMVKHFKNDGKIIMKMPELS